MTYVCGNCGCQFIGWACDCRKYCSHKCALKRVVTHGETKTRLHRIWCMMKNRCLCPTNASYNNYGGRGITVCREWIDNYLSFRDWALANGYRDNLEIDRHPNKNGNYEPSNCRWATRGQQVRNTRKRCDGVTSPFKGVCWNAVLGQWKAACAINGRRPYIGIYKTALEAALAYDDVAFAISGDLSGLNFPSWRPCEAWNRGAQRCESVARGSLSAVAGGEEKRRTVPSKSGIAIAQNY